MGFRSVAQATAFLFTRDRRRVTSFHGGTLGVPLTHGDEFAVAFDRDGITFRISTVADYVPPHTMLE